MKILKIEVLLSQLIQNFVVLLKITREKVPESFNTLAWLEVKISMLKILEFYEKVTLYPWGAKAPSFKISNYVQSAWNFFEILLLRRNSVHIAKSHFLLLSPFGCNLDSTPAYGALPPRGAKFEKCFFFYLRYMIRLSFFLEECIGCSIGRNTINGDREEGHTKE